MCDVVYAVLADRVERDVDAERAAIRIAVAVHGGKAELPTLDDRLAALDADLAAPLPTASERDDLHRLLGVA